jgi:hypothetical protein
MNIRNSTRVNESVSGSMVALQAEVLSLRGQIEALSRAKLETRMSPFRSPKRPLTPIGSPSRFDDKENRVINICATASTSSPACASDRDSNLELIKINRELEDLLEEKEALVAERDGEILRLKEAMEKCEYEAETLREASEGRFGHANVLISTLGDLERDNRNLITEVRFSLQSRAHLFPRLTP